MTLDSKSIASLFINTNEVTIWARMQKFQLKTWKCARKSVKHKLADQLVELKDDGSLFARMLIVARSRHEINLKDSVGDHKFTSIPRALFYVSGELLPRANLCTYLKSCQPKLASLSQRMSMTLLHCHPGRQLSLMGWRLSRQWVNHVGSRHVPSGLTTSQPYSIASVGTMMRSI